MTTEAAAIKKRPAIRCKGVFTTITPKAKRGSAASAEPVGWGERLCCQSVARPGPWKSTSDTIMRGPRQSTRWEPIVADVQDGGSPECPVSSCSFLNAFQRSAELVEIVSQFGSVARQHCKLSLGGIEVFECGIERGELAGLGHDQNLTNGLEVRVGC